MNKKIKKINILSSWYTIKYKELDNVGGYCDYTSKELVISTAHTGCSDENFAQERALRHEIVHAFFIESGLGETWEHKNIGQEETVVDWFALQAPKIFKIYKELDIL